MYIHTYIRICICIHPGPTREKEIEKERACARVRAHAHTCARRALDVALSCSVFQCVTVCVLQCVAVCARRALKGSESFSALLPHAPWIRSLTRGPQSRVL